MAGSVPHQHHIGPRGQNFLWTEPIRVSALGPAHHILQLQRPPLRLHHLGQRKIQKSFRRQKVWIFAETFFQF